MSARDHDFYRMDDILLRIGATGFILLLLAGGLGILYAQTLAQDPSYPPDYAYSLIGQYALLYLGLLACAGFTLRLGWKIRQRERRIGALWKLMQRNAQVYVPDLIANSDFEIEDLERGVKMLNTRGLGHYVWDRKTSTIQDGRLRTMQVHVEKCEMCGSSVALQVPIGFTQVPICPYCNDPVSVSALEERRHDMLQTLYAEHAPEQAPWQTFATRISIPTFAILFFAFWPAALVYVWYRYHVADPD